MEDCAMELSDSGPLDSPSPIKMEAGEKVEAGGKVPVGVELIGRKVRKKFGRKFYGGEVRSFDAEVGWYMVVYEDSDQEEVDFDELKAILVPEAAQKLRRSGGGGKAKPGEKRRSSVVVNDGQANDKQDEGPKRKKGKRSPKQGAENKAEKLSGSCGEAELPKPTKRSLMRKSSLNSRISYREKRMKPLEWPEIEVEDSKDDPPEPCSLDRVKEVWNLSEDAVSLVKDLDICVYVDEALNTTMVDKVKQCQLDYYQEWAKHDHIERVKNAGNRTINNAIRIAERSMEGKKVNTKAVIGHVPGIPTNLQVQVRGELNCIGLHRPRNRAGCVAIVEYTPEKGESVPLAVSVVVSRSKGVRADEVDEMVFIGDGGEYETSEGGRTRVRKHKTDQGLVNCHRFGIPIRLIRQMRDKECVLKYKYSYEGLWWVSEAWSDVGESGSRMMKFRLVRMSKGGPGEGKVLLRPRERVICEDIAFGKEMVKIPVVNGVDNALPPGFDASRVEGLDMKGYKKADYRFHYTPVYVYHPSVGYPALPVISSDADPHELIEKFNEGNPYSQQKGSRIPLLNERRCILVECGPWCQCGLANNCHYAVTERGIQFKLQVFRTLNRGWGVRTLEYIPAGAYVCTYIGEIVPHGDPTVAVGTEYVFDMCRRMDMSDNHDYLDDLRSDIKIKYAVDAKHRGNVARFINHSCDPNVFVQPTLSTHLDKEMPKICLFAMKHIFPGEELTYDYGHQFVMDGLKGRCRCGASNCITRKTGLTNEENEDDDSDNETSNDNEVAEAMDMDMEVNGEEEGTLVEAVTKSDNGVSVVTEVEGEGLEIAGENGGEAVKKVESDEQDVIASNKATSDGCIACVQDEELNEPSKDVKEGGLDARSQDGSISEFSI